MIRSDCRNNASIQEILVLGAGPYGLATAAHLRERGIATRTTGTVMSSWEHNMPEGMILKSTPAASSIASPRPGTGLDTFRSLGGRPSRDDTHLVDRDEFVNYGRWFEARHRLDVDPAFVRRIARAGRTFEVDLSSGDALRPPAVVVAAGHVAHAFIPPELHLLVDAGVCTHTSAHHCLAAFDGCRVVVVGAGQSALETAALLHEHGAHTTVVARSRVVRWGVRPPAGPAPWHRRLHKPESALGPGWSLRTVSGMPALMRRAPRRARHAMVRNVLGPAGAWWLRDRVIGRIPIIAGCRVTSARVDRDGCAHIMLAGADAPRELVADHVIVGTGYRVDVRRLDFLDQQLRHQLAVDNGWPCLRPTFESSVPNLYFTGLPAAFTFGPLLRFVHGTHFAAPRVADSIASRQRR